MRIHREKIIYVSLARHERRILSLVARCYANGEIAAILNLSVNTVSGVLKSVSLGLGCSGRAQLLRWVISYPEALLGEKVPRDVHPEGCHCGTGFCRAAEILVVPAPRQRRRNAPKVSAA